LIHYAFALRFNAKNTDTFENIPYLPFLLNDSDSVVPHHVVTVGGSIMGSVNSG